MSELDMPVTYFLDMPNTHFLSEDNKRQGGSAILKS